MNIEEYEEKTKVTITDSLKDLKENDPGRYLDYIVLGLGSEAGEVLGKLKKIIRDNDGVIDDTRKEEIKKELGDVLWYMARLAESMDSSISEIADINLKKLLLRLERGKIGGSGDNR